MKQFMATFYSIEYVAIVSRSACTWACCDFAICRSAVLCVAFDD